MQCLCEPWHVPSGPDALERLQQARLAHQTRDALFRALGDLALVREAWAATALDLLSARVAAGARALDGGSEPMPAAALGAALLLLDRVVDRARRAGPSPAWRAALGAAEGRLEQAVRHRANARPLLAHSLWRLLAKIDDAGLSR